MNFDHSSIIAYWKENLIQYKNPLIGLKHEFPTELKDFLAEVGLPNRETLLIRFVSAFYWLDSDNSTLRNRYLILAEEDLFSDICIDTKANYEIVQITRKDRERRFLNSSLQQFILSLTEYEKTQDLRIGENNELLDSDENIRLVGVLESKLSAIDEKIKTSGHFWPLVIEQMEMEQL